MLLTADVVVYVHPIDPDAHPMWRGGWRWAVHVGGQPPDDVRYCANAGRAGSRAEAALIGESHGAAAAKALRILGIPATYHAIRDLDYDPIPADLDDAPVGVWQKGS